MAFLVAERQILSQHKQNNNLVVMVSKGIQFVDLVYKLHVGSKNIIFTFTGTLQISRGFLFFFWLPLKRIFLKTTLKFCDKDLILTSRVYYNFSYHAIDLNEVIFDASFSWNQGLVVPQLTTQSNPKN